MKKSAVEWVVQDTEGSAVVIYCWKEQKVPEGEHGWHIGGQSVGAVTFVAKTLGMRAERKLGEPLAKVGAGNQHTKGKLNRSQHFNGSGAVTLESLGVMACF